MPEPHGQGSLRPTRGTLALAWAAASASTGEHALIAAKAASQRYGAEPAVAEELAFLSETIELKKRALEAAKESQKAEKAAAKPEDGAPPTPP